MMKDGIEPEEYTITNINYDNSSATAQGIHNDPKMDSITFYLEKRNGNWIVINYGTGW